MEIVDNPRVNQPCYAGFWLRFVAYIIDRAILSVASIILAIPAILIIVSLSLGFSKISNYEEFFQEGNLLKVGVIIGIIILLSLFNLVTGWLYYALMEASKYRGTVGKIALSIKVTDLKGERVSFGRATGRYFARIVTNLTFLIGYIMAGFTERKQALHDVIASCIVVKE